MNKCLFLAAFAVLWSGCSRSEQAGVPQHRFEAVCEVHPDSARFDALMLPIWLRVVIRPRKLGGRIYVAREIVRNGVSFDALTYLERAELLFRATK